MDITLSYWYALPPPPLVVLIAITSIIAVDIAPAILVDITSVILVDMVVFVYAPEGGVQHGGGALLLWNLTQSPPIPDTQGSFLGNTCKQTDLRCPEPDFIRYFVALRGDISRNPKLGYQFPTPTPAKRRICVFPKMLFKCGTCFNRFDEYFESLNLFWWILWEPEPVLMNTLRAWTCFDEYFVVLRGSHHQLVAHGDGE